MFAEPGVGLGIRQLVLELRDAALRARGRQAVGIRLVLLDEPLEERARVARVVDRERLREPELLGLAAEDAHAGGVERRDPHALRAVADEVRDALAHLARGLVRERDREDLARPRLLRLRSRLAMRRVSTLVLPEPAPGDDQQRRTAIGDGLALRRVEAREQVFVGAHGGRRPIAAPGPRSPPTMIRAWGVGHGPSSLGAHPDTDRDSSLPLARFRRDPRTAASSSDRRLRRPRAGRPIGRPYGSASSTPSTASTSPKPGRDPRGGGRDVEVDRDAEDAGEAPRQQAHLVVPER